MKGGKITDKRPYLSQIELGLLRIRYSLDLNQ